jgi:hypothetical protein
LYSAVPAGIIGPMVEKKGFARDQVKVRISIGRECYEEKKYALEVILSEILGLRCEWSSSAAESGFHLIEFPNGYLIRLKDSFFGSGPASSVLLAERLPSGLVSARHPAYPEPELVAFYGDSALSQDQAGIEVGPDIVATAFFLLTRWEEAARGERDRFGRFPDDLGFARRAGIEGRALVNEYAWWIHALARASGADIPDIPNRFAMVPTHDMDKLYGMGFRRAAREAWRHRLFKRFIAWFLYKALFVSQADTIRRMIRTSREAGAVSRFYWMAGGSYPYDRYYDIGDAEVAKLIALMKAEGQAIGFHPSSDTKSDEAAWTREKENLEAALGGKVSEGRQHFLKFDAPETFRIWEKQGMEYDSSMGFSRGVGFRCGTGSEFPLYDFKAGRKMALRERPLLVMDAAIRKGKLRKNDLRKALAVKEICRKYRMPCVILFHNHTLDPVPWNSLAPLYRKLMRDE